MNSQRVALIAGATGMVGHFCLLKLLESPNYSKVIALTRRPLEIKDPKLDNRTIEFDAIFSEVSDISCDDLFCCLGTTIKQAGSRAAFRQVDYTYCLSLAKLGLQSNAKHFLLISALGAHSKSPIFYSRVKGELENAIAQLGYDRCSIFQPSLLVGARELTRRAEEMAINATLKLSALLVGPFADCSVIRGEDLASAMLMQALQEDTKGGSTLQRLRYRKIMRLIDH